MMTMQEIFDKAVGGVLKQGRLSMDAEANMCMYRLEDNGVFACVVGQLIRDEDYDPFIEGHGLFSELNLPEVNEKLNETLTKAGVDLYDGKSRWLLVELQQAHDHANTLDEFKDKAFGVGQKYGLNKEVCKS